MARLIRVPGLASLLLVSTASEVDELIAHPALDRAFVASGPLVNRMLVRRLDRQIRRDGRVLDAFRPRDDAERKAAQAKLFADLDRIASAGAWPAAPIGELARYVVEGSSRRNARAALAFAVAWPFLGETSHATRDDAYRPIGRHLWRLHRLTERARRPLSLSGSIVRLLGLDRRARRQILTRTGGGDYGLHAVEITLANAWDSLERMRRTRKARAGSTVTSRDLTWAAFRTAPELVLRQSGEGHLTLPHVRDRLPPRTLVLLRMRTALTEDVPSGFEFASSHWSGCPARRYVMQLFAAVAGTATDLARGRRHL